MKVPRDKITETGGRSATTRHIPPKLALAVGMPATSAPKGWQWSALTSLARLESGHTPSRKHPEYWGGSIPWISISDARAHDGRLIEDTEEKTNDLGIANSSARILPANTVCLSRTASVGYVMVMGQPMATSQDFVNWVCSKNLDHNFLKYLLIAEDEDLLRFASGSVHQTIYFPEVKAFHICHPPLPEQQRIVGLLDEAFEGLATAKSNAEKNLQNARALFGSHLQAVFTQRDGGWPTKQLGDVCDFEGGSQPPKSEFLYSPKAGYVRFLQIRDFGSEKHVTFIPESKKNRLCRADDIMIGRYGASVGKILTGKAGAYNVALMKTIPDLARLDRSFFYHFLISGAFQEQLTNVAARSAQNGFSKDDIYGFPVPVPPLEEQQKVIEQLGPLSEQTQHLARLYQQKLAALDSLKKSLLHQAFSGEL